MRGNIKQFFVGGLLAAFGSLASHAEERTHYEDVGLQQGRSYIRHHVAENIDPFSGNLSLQHTDLVIPGNGGFDLKIQRSYNSASISETLSPFGRGWNIHFGRVKHPANQSCSAALPQKLHLQLPDGSSQTFHRSNGVASTSAATDFLTTSFWKAQCNSLGGMTVWSPDGTQFDMTEVDAQYWHAKTITDRFGNQFQLSYATDTTTGTKVVSQVS